MMAGRENKKPLTVAAAVLIAFLAGCGGVGGMRVNPNAPDDASGILTENKAPSGAFVPSPTPDSGSGADAPPISLPAPVTGRLTITSPDANYSSLAIGDAQGAPNNSLVMVVDDTKSETASRGIDWRLQFGLARLMDLFIPSAQADLAFPDICNLPYHACGPAGPEGDFEINLMMGDIGDTVSIGVIDPASGEWLATPVTRLIPDNVRALPWRVNDVGYYAPSLAIPDGKGKLYSLMSHATAMAMSGEIEIRDPLTGVSTSVPWDGSHPARIDVNETGNPGANYAAVVDTADGFAGLVDLSDDNDFSSPKKYFPMTAIASYPPTDAALSHDATKMVVALNPSLALVVVAPSHILEIIDTMATPMGPAAPPITEATLATSGLPGFGTGAQHIETRAIAQYYHGPTNTDVYAFVGFYRPLSGADAGPYVGLLSALTGGHQVISMVALPPGTNPTDVAFSFDSAAVFVTDNFNNVVWRVQYNADFPDVTTRHLSTDALSDAGRLVQEPLEIEVDHTYKRAYVAQRNGNAVHADSLVFINNLNEVTSMRDIGLRPTGIALSHGSGEIYTSTAKSHSITTWMKTDFTP